MKVLVTGANGFIGKNLCIELMNKGHIVLSYDIDKSNANISPKTFTFPPCSIFYFIEFLLPFYHLKVSNYSFCIFS